MTFYSYLYKDPYTLVLRYAGKGSGNRAYIHLGNRCDNKQLKGWIKKLKEQDSQPVIEIYNAFDEHHSCFLEECFIQIFGRLDNNTGTLFNHTNGGEGISGYVHTAETKKKISEASKKRVVSPLSQNHKDKISRSLKGRTFPKKKRKTGFKKPSLSNRERTEKELANLKTMTEKIKLKVEICGIQYSSITDAANALGIHNETLRYRCRSTRFTDYKILGDVKCRA